MKNMKSTREKLTRQMKKTERRQQNMTAIYKKELRSYFTSMTGYICMAFMLVVIGIYFAVINLSSGYPYFGYTLSCVIVLFLLMTPVLTMRILAEEKNRKTDQLLLTAPVSLWKIVIGKYLAMVTVFGLALLITCFYPLILSRFGTVSLPMAYTAILGYFLYGAACIAIGLFISSVTESQVIAALLTFFVLLVFYITGVITNALPSTAVASFVIWIFVILFAAWLVYNLTSNIKIAVAAAIIAEAVNVIIFFAKSEWMAGSVAKVLGAFNMTSFFSNFGSGVFDITGIVYYLSIIGFCIFLTIQSIQRKRWGGDALMTAVVLAIVVVINLVVGQIPVKYTQFDLTDNQLYTITDQTKTFVKGLDSDVDVYLVAQSGQEDEQIQKVLERYESLVQSYQSAYKGSGGQSVLYKAVYRQFPVRQQSDRCVWRKNIKSSTTVIFISRSLIIPHTAVRQPDSTQKVS
ncbi:MAG: ABC transporter permease [Lachnospiraceae bacterium]